MTFDSFISSTHLSPVAGIGLLILFIYGGNYLVQIAVGSRLPYLGRISTFAASLTAWVLTLFVLIACREQPAVHLRWVLPVGGGPGADELPFFLSMGLELNEWKSLLMAVAGGIHLLLLLNGHRGEDNSVPPAPFWADSSLCSFAVMLLLMSADLPLMLLAWVLAAYALSSMYRYPYQEWDLPPLYTFLANKLGEIFILLALILLMLRFRTWHLPLLRNLQLQLVEGHWEVLLSWKNHSNTHYLFPISLALNFFLLFVGFMLKAWANVWWGWMRKHAAAMRSLQWGHASLLFGAGLYTLLSLKQLALPAAFEWLWTVPGGLLLLGVVGVYRSWLLQHIWAYALLALAGLLLLMDRQASFPTAALFSSWVAGTLAMLSAAWLSVKNEQLMKQHNMKMFILESSGPAALNPSDYRFMGGLGRRMPLLAAMQAVAAATLAGLPFFGGYVQKISFLKQLLAGPFSLGDGMLLLLFLASHFVLLFYFARLLLLLLNKHNLLERANMGREGGLFSLETAAGKQQAAGAYRLSWQSQLALWVLAAACLWIWASALMPGSGSNWAEGQQAHPALQGWLDMGWNAFCVVGLLAGWLTYRSKKTVNLLTSRPQKSH